LSEDHFHKVIKIQEKKETVRKGEVEKLKQQAAAAGAGEKEAKLNAKQAAKEGAKQGAQWLARRFCGQGSLDVDLVFLSNI
jgi:hypothetical protein